MKEEIVLIKVNGKSNLIVFISLIVGFAIKETFHDLQMAQDEVEMLGEILKDFELTKLRWCSDIQMSVYNLSSNTVELNKLLPFERRYYNTHCYTMWT